MDHQTAINLLEIIELIEQYSDGEMGVVVITRGWGKEYKCEIRWDSKVGSQQTSFGGPMPLDSVIGKGQTLAGAVMVAIEKRKEIASQ